MHYHEIQNHISERFQVSLILHHPFPVTYLTPWPLAGISVNYRL